MDSNDKELEPDCGPNCSEIPGLPHEGPCGSCSPKKAIKGDPEKRFKGSKMFIWSLNDDGFQKHDPLLVLEDTSNDSFLYTTELEEMTNPNIGSSPFGFTFRQEADAQRVFVVLNDQHREHDEL